MKSESSLWQAVDALAGGRAAELIKGGLDQGLSYEAIARQFHDLGVSVSREWVRQQALRLGVAA